MNNSYHVFRQEVNWWYFDYFSKFFIILISQTHSLISLTLWYDWHQVSVNDTWSLTKEKQEKKLSFFRYTSKVLIWYKSSFELEIEASPLCVSWSNLIAPLWIPKDKTIVCHLGHLVYRYILLYSFNEYLLSVDSSSCFSDSLLLHLLRQKEYINKHYCQSTLMLIIQWEFLPAKQQLGKEESTCYWLPNPTLKQLFCWNTK